MFQQCNTPNIITGTTLGTSLIKTSAIFNAIYPDLVAARTPKNPKSYSILISIHLDIIDYSSKKNTRHHHQHLRGQYLYVTSLINAYAKEIETKTKRKSPLRPNSSQPRLNKVRLRRPIPQSRSISNTTTNPHPARRTRRRPIKHENLVPSRRRNMWGRRSGQRASCCVRSARTADC